MSVRHPPPPPTEDLGEEQAPLRCARHPNTETLLRCGRCGTPICAKCQVPTPVGVRCRSCAQVKRFALVARPSELLRAAALGLAVAVVGSIVLGMVPFLGFFGLAFVGFAVGEAVSVSARRKQGRELGILAVACLVVGYALGPFVGALLGGRAVPLELVAPLTLALLLNPATLLGLLLGGLLAWMRAR